VIDKVSWRRGGELVGTALQCCVDEDGDVGIAMPRGSARGAVLSVWAGGSVVEESMYYSRPAGPGAIRQSCAPAAWRRSRNTFDLCLDSEQEHRLIVVSCA
jgi:hypothetical protein